MCLASAFAAVDILELLVRLVTVIHFSHPTCLHIPRRFKGTVIPFLPLRFDAL